MFVYMSALVASRHTKRVMSTFLRRREHCRREDKGSLETPRSKGRRLTWLLDEHRSPCNLMQSSYLDAECRACVLWTGELRLPADLDLGSCPTLKDCGRTLDAEQLHPA